MCHSSAFPSEALGVLRRLECGLWSGVEYLGLAVATAVRRVLFVSRLPGASLADRAVSVQLMPLNIAKISFYFFHAKFQF